MKKESEKAGKVLKSTVEEKKTPEEQKPEVKKEESNIEVVKKKKTKGIEHPDSPVLKIKQETDGKQ